MADLSFLTEAELKDRGEHIRELDDAISQRQQTFTELDDMTYDQWYLANKKAGTGYIRPKKNRQDLRTVTGTTREKVNTVVTSLLRYNFDFRIDAWDENNWPERSLGFGLEGLVQKSRVNECPTYKEKLPVFYEEFVSQGNVFLFEASVQEEEIRKTLRDKKIEDVMKVKWDEKKEMVERCEVDMVPGLNVYLGNIRDKYMEKQPYIGLRRELTDLESEALYSNFERWKQVKESESGPVHILHDQGGQQYNDWNMLQPKKGYREEIRYYNLHKNVYQIYLDGVPMLPVGFPLEVLLGVKKYPVIKVDGEPISRYFAYCRGISSKNKFNQAIMDEFFRVLLLKFRKSTSPPMANLTGKQLNKSIFYPSTIHQGIDPEKLKPIGDNSAVTGPEFETFRLVKSIIDESSVSPIFEGQRSPGEQTAKEISELKSQSMMRLGFIMLGIIQMEEKLIWLRIYNLLRNYTKPDEQLKEVKGKLEKVVLYKTETVERELEEGSKGMHMIEFGEEMLEEEQVMAEEDILSRKKGVTVRKTYLNAKVLGKLRHKFLVTVVPTEKEATELRAALFEESLMKAKQIWPQSVNDKYAQEKWANYQRLDSRKFFIENAPVMPGQEATTGEVGAQMLPQTTQQQKPALKRML